MSDALRIRSRFITTRMSAVPLSILLAVSLIGCSSEIQMANQKPTTGPTLKITPAPADNWQFLLTPAASEAPWATDIEAVLSLTPDEFVGTAHMIVGSDLNNVSCYIITDPIPLSGTIDTQGNILVTSAPVRGQVLSFTGVMTSDRSSISLGTYTFKGGCADGHSGTLTGLKFKTIGGVYTGTLTEPSAAIAVTADLNQSSTSDNFGFLEVKGTVSYTSPTCTDKFAVTTSQLAGRTIRLDLVSPTDGLATTVYGSVNAQVTQMSLADYEGGCNGLNGVGILSLE